MASNSQGPMVDSEHVASSCVVDRHVTPPVFTHCILDVDVRDPLILPRSAVAHTDPSLHTLVVHRIGASTPQIGAPNDTSQTSEMFHVGGAVAGALGGCFGIYYGTVFFYHLLSPVARLEMNQAKVDEIACELSRIEARLRKSASTNRPSTSNQISDIFAVFLPAADVKDVNDLMSGVDAVNDALEDIRGLLDEDGWGKWSIDWSGKTRAMLQNVEQEIRQLCVETRRSSTAYSKMWAHQREAAAVRKQLHVQTIAKDETNAVVAFLASRGCLHNDYNVDYPDLEATA